MKRIVPSLSLLLGVVIGAALPLRPLAAQTVALPSVDGVWCWFSDPRAVYYEGQYRRTYAGWIDQDGNITVGYYDHRTGTLTSRVLHPGLEVDDHDHPALLFTPDGRLQVYYTRHATETPIYLMEARFPESLDDWAPRRELHLNDTVRYAGLRNSYTYVNPVRLAAENDRLYLFWRGMDFKPNVAHSDDGGRSWSTGRILILPERSYANRRPYLKVADNGSDRIHLAFTDGHPRNEPTNSIYYAVYREGAFYRADGALICSYDSLPFAPSAVDRVYDAAATGEKAWIWDVAADSLNRPVVVYARFLSDSVHVYWYARWDGRRWQNHRITEAGKWFPHTPPRTTEPEPNYSGGLSLDQEDPSLVYLSREVDGVFTVEAWRTSDGGQTWQSTPLAAPSKEDQVRPAAVRHAGPGNPLQALWLSLARYRYYTDYRGSIRGGILRNRD